MSHIVEIKTEVRDVEAVRAASRRLNLDTPTLGTAKLFSGEATGVIVKLPNWQYPVVFNTETGQAHYDNYQGHWGDQKELERFLQMYAVEKARLEARKRGHSVTETNLADGSIKLVINVGSAV